MRRTLAAAGACVIPWKGSFPQAREWRLLCSSGNISPENSPLRQQQRYSRFFFSPRTTDLQHFPRAGLCAVCDETQEHKIQEANKTFSSSAKSNGITFCSVHNLLQVSRHPSFHLTQSGPFIPTSCLHWLNSRMLEVGSVKRSRRQHIPPCICTKFKPFFSALLDTTKGTCSQ